jgi:HSP20 family protein
MVRSLTGFLSSPFDEFWRLQQEMDELFGNEAPTGGIRSLPRGSFPAINVVNTRDAVNAYVFAPGIDPKKLDISIQQNLLTIAGERQVPIAENGTYYRRERFSGEFRRVIGLPEDVDPERVDAKFRDGIVQVSVRRRESAQPRQIEIH